MAAAAESPLAGLRILIVEDEFLVADHVAMVIEDFGCEVVGPVPSIDQAIRIIGDEALDGALLDANLGGASSAPIADALALRSIPFVVLTGYGGLSLATAALDNAPRVTKPLIVSALDQTMRAAFAH